MDDIVVFDDGFTANDIKKVFSEFRKFNSSAQRIPLEYLPVISKKRKITIIKLVKKNLIFVISQVETG